MRTKGTEGHEVSHTTPIVPVGDALDAVTRGALRGLVEDPLDVHGVVRVQRRVGVRLWPGHELREGDTVLRLCDAMGVRKRDEQEGGQPVIPSTPLQTTDGQRRRGRTYLARSVGDGAELKGARGREEVQGTVEAGRLARDDHAGLLMLMGVH